MLNKITRTPFKSAARKFKILDLVYNFLCDFYSTPSLGNNKYVITLIDDYSKFCYVYLLYVKDEALNFFKIYKSKVQLQVGCKLERLRTVKRGEYYDPTSFQFMGIIHEITVDYAPQSNVWQKGRIKLFKRW